MKEKFRAQLLDGQLEGVKESLYGMYKGYYVTFETVTNTFVVKIHASSASDEKNAQLAEFLQRKKDEVKGLIDIKVYDYFVALQMKATNKPEIVNGIVEPVIDYLENYGYVSGCKQCGNTNEPLSCYEINGNYHFICSNCIGSVESSFAERQKNIKASKSNLIAGLVGALLGALLGCLLWIGIYKIGYIAGIAGAVIAICAMKGYEMLGGHLDKKGVIGSVLIMVFSIYFANKIAWSWEAYDALKEYGLTFSDCFRAIGQILSDSGLTGSYYTDLLIGYALTALASFSNIRTALRASTGEYTIKKVK